MNPTELRAEIDRLGPWHHAVELAPGIWTAEAPAPGARAAETGTPSIIRPEARLTQLLGEVYPNGLEGRSFLDCACNGGGYLFAAARLGASRCFGFDVREHWIEQARFLSRHRPSANVEFVRCDLAALPGLGLPVFDVTLFSGILYHLPDPIAGLRAAADRTGELLIVHTAIRPRPEDALVLVREDSGPPMSGVHGLAWLPTNFRTVAAMLEYCGFPHVRLRFDIARPHGRRRIEVLAARDASTFDWHDAQRPERIADHGGAQAPISLGQRLRRWTGRA